MEGQRMHRGAGSGVGWTFGLAAWWCSPKMPPEGSRARSLESTAQPRGGHVAAAHRPDTLGSSKTDGLPAPSCSSLPCPGPWSVSAVVCLEVLAVGLIWVGSPSPEPLSSSQTPGTSAALQRQPVFVVSFHSGKGTGLANHQVMQTYVQSHPCSFVADLGDWPHLSRTRSPHLQNHKFVMGIKCTFYIVGTQKTTVESESTKHFSSNPPSPLLFLSVGPWGIQPDCKLPEWEGCSGPK